ncbi:MAG: SspB family protein [Bauldia sp.]|nr:SspB family protein [Bauldia sp.]
MAEDLIRYDILAQDALRGVVRKVLSEVARTGLPGDHHFFVTFATTAPGVRVSTRLLSQYPEEITIVLQHQYWDLMVSEHAFEVGLSFKGIPERIFAPFSAIKAFADPSVGFQLHFAVAQTAARTLAGEDKPVLASVQPATPDTKPKVAEDEPAEATPPAVGLAEVVSLDAFRKK